MTGPNRYHGLLQRVAVKLNVDRTYVSRVASGQRNSPQIQAALVEEMAAIDAKAGTFTANGTADRKPARLKRFIRDSAELIRQELLTQTQTDPRISKARLAPTKRTTPLLDLMTEMMRLIQYTPQEIANKQLSAAIKHGSIRRAQGYPVDAMLEEYNLIRRSVYAVAIKYSPAMNQALLLHDLAQVGEVMDRQMQCAVVSYFGQSQ